MKNSQMNIPHLHLILFRLKSFGEIVTPRLNIEFQEQIIETNNFDLMYL